jgi:hypothetical protein
MQKFRMVRRPIPYGGLMQTFRMVRRPIPNGGLGGCAILPERLLQGETFFLLQASAWHS